MAGVLFYQGELGWRVDGNSVIGNWFLDADGEEEKQGLGERCCSTDKNFILREGPEESIKGSEEEVLGGSCIKGKFYKYSN